MRDPVVALATTLLLTACAKPGLPWQKITVVKPPVERSSAIPRQARVFTFLNEQRGFKAADHLVFATGDGGRTWSQVGSLDSPVTYLDFLTATDGWAATDSGLRRTTDGGRTWQSGTELIRDRVDRVDFADGLQGWALLQGTLLQTTDGGRDWGAGSQPCTGPTVFSLPLPQTGFLICTNGVAMGRQPKSLFRTDDGGAHWSLVTDAQSGATSGSGLPEYGVATDLFFLADGQHGWLTTDRNGAYATDDGGQTWRRLGLRLGADFRGIRFATPDHGFALSNWAPGLFLETRDGGATWSQIYPDLEPADAKALLGGQTVIGAGTLQESGAILRSEDGGRHWQQVAAISGGGVAAFSFADSLHGWAVVYVDNRNQLYRTEDGGRTWTGPLPGLRYLDLNGISMAMVDAQTGYLADNTGALRKTTDGGDSFTVLPQPLEQNVQIAFGDAAHGWKLADHRLFTTADEGKTWTRVDLPYEISQVSAASGGQAWAIGLICGENVRVCHQAALATRDFGRTWTQFDLGAEISAVAPAKDNLHVWAFGDNVTLTTADGGKHWTQIK